VTCSKREAIKAALFAIITAETPASADAKPFLSGVNGTVNMQDVYQSLTEIENTNIPASSQVIMSLSYAVPGDLRGFTMVFKRTTSAPPYALGGYVRSADRHLPNGTIDKTNGGYWLLTNETVTPMMFGAPCAGVNGPNTSSDDYPAIANMVSYCEDVPHLITMYNGEMHSKKSIYYPSGFYYCSQTITHNKGVRIRGGERAGRFTWNCVITFALGQGGLVIKGGQTEIEGLYFKSIAIDSAGDHPRAHGIHILAPTFCRAVSVANFSGYGFFVDGNSTSNPDECIFERCYANDCGLDGFYAVDGNANVCYYYGCSSNGNFGCGFNDQSQLGNTYVACHTNGNGAPGANWGGLTGRLVNQGCACQYGGLAYAVVPGLELGASTTPPGTNPAVWFATGHSTTGLPFWKPGLAWKAQYPFAIVSGTPVIGCYSEDNQWPSYFAPGALVFSPEIIVNGTDSFNMKNPSYSLFGTQWGLSTRTGFVAQNLPVPTDAVQYGVVSSFGADSSFFPHANFAPFRITRGTELCNASGTGIANAFLFYEGVNPSNGDIVIATKRPAYANQGLLFTGYNSAYGFGSAQNQRGIPTFARLGLALNGFANGTATPQIILDANTAPPGTGGPANYFSSGVGWFRFNTAVVPGGPFAWVCTTAGVGGGGIATYVWTPLYANLAPCTVANLPTASTANKGARGMVTDATATTFASIVAGTGKNVVPVYSDGTNWRIG
jgi:hypothetical protein